ncbi:hypothetical protein EYZ11_000397 [Aspergillus tanneri]|nr:hypothetical protein EYZ11_000397 [Aspergillus tanneri]
MSEPSGQILSIFRTFRDELDEHHDRRERLVKISRDITALSKKIVRTINAPIPASIAKETQSRFTQIQDLFRSTVPDITGINNWRYQRQLSGAVQEFIEAISFRQYLQTQTLISLEEVTTQLPSEILVTEEDYLMGLFDLTGEMMRFAITTLSTGAQKQQTDSTEEVENTGHSKLGDSQAGIVVDLREMRSLFEGLSVPRRHNTFMYKDMAKKMDVMQSSVEKVERAAYGILVRGSERPAGWMPDLSAPVEMESY